MREIASAGFHADRVHFSLLFSLPQHPYSQSSPSPHPTWSSSAVITSMNSNWCIQVHTCTAPAVILVCMAGLAKRHQCIGNRVGLLGPSADVSGPLMGQEGQQRATLDRNIESGRSVCPVYALRTGDRHKDSTCKVNDGVHRAQWGGSGVIFFADPGSRSVRPWRSLCARNSSSHPLCQSWGIHLAS